LEGPQSPGIEQAPQMQEQAPQMPEQAPQLQEPDTAQTGLDKMLSQLNLAEELDEDLLEKIGTEVHRGYEVDLKSKEAWDQQVDEWVKLATQIKEPKTFPWPNASNVKYPLLATAAMQFAARAYPSLVPADGKIAQFRVVGADPQGLKAAKADKLAKHMNYQLLKDMGSWEEEMDRLLIMLPIVGCLFKKTYFDPIRKTNCSKLVGPKDLIVNYWASGLEDAYRKTELVPMTKNAIRAHVNGKIFLDVELGDPSSAPKVAGKSDVHGNEKPAVADASTPFLILEQHTYWDLDEDGYEEPYIITIDEASKKVLRIVARWDSDGIITNDDKELVCIEPVEYYTKYGFIPNPDGGFYDIGFGHLLGPLNESANTVINQLTDAGTISNLQSGFIGKGIRLKLGENRVQPGEWKTVNATGDDIRKQVFPLPVREPSEVLFKLLGLLLDSGRELASVAEIFTGKMPGQNTPATTTQTAVEQGMKVFTAIYKRVYRSLTKEFEKLFRLNSLFDENFEKAQRILDEPISKEDYDPKSYDICPTADPTAISTTQKLMKSQMLMEVLPLGTLNAMEVTKRILEAQEQPNMEALMQQQQPPPDPKLMQAEAKMKTDAQKAQLDAQKTQMEMKVKQLEVQMDQQAAMMDQKFMAMERAMKMKLDQQEHEMKQRHAEQAHTSKLAQQAEMAKNAARNKGKVS